MLHALKLSQPARRCQFHRDGQSLATIADDEVRLWSLDGQPRQRFRPGPGSLDFDWLARCAHGLKVYRFGNPRPVHSVTVGWEGASVSALAIRPDGRKVLLGGSSYHPAAPGLPDDSIYWLFEGPRLSDHSTQEFGTRTDAGPWAATATPTPRPAAGFSFTPPYRD